MQTTSASPFTRAPSTTRWSLATRVEFRFAFAFFVLWFFPQPFDVSLDWISVVFPKLVAWVASRVLDVDIPQIRYSTDAAGGDGVYGIARSLLLLAIALVATFVWSAADRKRTHYEALHAWLRLYVRVVLGAYMLEYGSWKVFFPDQMRPPTLSSLLVPFGDLSPIARLWLFMGSSHIYTFCTGAVEMISGALLFVPGLTTVGALISAGALTNVVLLDVNYDVGATQLAFFLLLMSIFLLVPEVRRFRDAFILRRAVPAQPERPLFTRNWLQNSAMLITLLAGCYWAGTDLTAEQRYSKTVSAKPLNTPYYGVWAVDEFTINGIDQPPLFTDPARWKLLVFDWAVPYPQPSLVIHFGPGTRRLFSLDFDSKRKSITLLRPNPLPGGSLSPEQRSLQKSPPAAGTLVMNDKDRDHLVLQGDFEGMRVRAVLHRTTPDPTVRRWHSRFFRDEILWGNDVII
jgi:hypothetical protein